VTEASNFISTSRVKAFKTPSEIYWEWVCMDVVVCLHISRNYLSKWKWINHKPQCYRTTDCKRKSRNRIFSKRLRAGGLWLVHAADADETKLSCVHTANATRQDSSKLGRDEAKLFCRRCEQAITLCEKFMLG